MQQARGQQTFSARGLTANIRGSVGRPASGLYSTATT